MKPTRSYRQIATILSARCGHSITPEQVEQVCRAAEEKIAYALMIDARHHQRSRIHHVTNRAERRAGV